MIKVNNKIIEVGHFPDGTQMLLNFEIDVWQDVPITITWCYEYEEEALTVMYLKRHIETSYNNKVELMLPYVPNARMDRVKSGKEIFTLKHFCWFINMLKFHTVYIMDPHSIVTEALIDNVCVLTPTNIIDKVIDEITFYNNENIVIYFPDDGAYKRYKDLGCFKGLKCVYGKKERDWETGKILGIEIYDKNGCKLTNELDKCTVLMVDDIISYGGTLAYSADRLKELGVCNIYAYATHVEDSVLNTEKGTLIKRINDGIVKKIYTTDSLFHEEHSNFVIVRKF